MGRGRGGAGRGGMTAGAQQSAPGTAGAQGSKCPHKGGDEGAGKRKGRRRQRRYERWGTTAEAQGSKRTHEDGDEGVGKEMSWRMCSGGASSGKFSGILYGWRRRILVKEEEVGVERVWFLLATRTEEFQNELLRLSSSRITYPSSFLIYNNESMTTIRSPKRLLTLVCITDSMGMADMKHNHGQGSMGYWETIHLCRACTERDDEKSE
jgi:hypothetical protein